MKNITSVDMDAFITKGSNITFMIGPNRRKKKPNSFIEAAALIDCSSK